MPLEAVDTTLRDFVKESRNLVSKGQLVAALDRMRVFFQYSPGLNAIIEQQRRLSDLANEIRLGLLTSEQSTVSKNQITHATLELLALLENQDISEKVDVQEEVQRAITHSKNLIIDSTIEAQTVNIGDSVINNYYNQYNQQPSLSRLEKNLLLQQKRVLKQYLITAEDEMYIELPKQQKGKETLALSTAINTAHLSKDLTQSDIEKIFFDECLSSMLILGAPGAGKTSLLAELGYKIAQRTLEEKKGYLPIFLNLTSWSNFRPAKKEKYPFWDWLLFELKNSYGIKGNKYQEILLSNRVVFLLDGLDEVTESKRLAFLKAFNTFILEHQIPIVVSCRKIEYDLLKKQASKQADNLLRLNGAIEIMPIQPTQLEAFLVKKGYEAIAQSYAGSASLQKLLNSPLWLSIAIKAFKTGRWDNFKNEPGNWKSQLLDAYEKWMLEEKLSIWNEKAQKVKTKKIKPYDKENVSYWIAWLAFIMQRENLSVLYLERMQAWFLPWRFLRRYEFRSYLMLGLIFGLIISLVAGLSFGISFNFMEGLITGIGAGILTILLTIIIYLGVFLFHGKKNRPIKLVENYPVTWTHNPLVPFVLAIIYGLLAGIIEGWVFGLIIGLFSALVLVMSDDISIIDTQLPETLVPRQGLINCLKYSLLALIPSFLVIVSLLIFKDDFGAVVNDGFYFTPFMIMIAGLFSIGIPLKMGFEGYNRHAVLMYFLRKAEYLPQKDVRFLNAACRLGYLKRVGGAYRFFHREFQEFLANKYADRFQEDYRPREETLKRFKID